MSRTDRPAQALEAKQRMAPCLEKSERYMEGRSASGSRKVQATEPAQAAALQGRMLCGRDPRPPWIPAIP